MDGTKFIVPLVAFALSNDLQIYCNLLTHRPNLIFFFLSRTEYEKREEEENIYRVCRVMIMGDFKLVPYNKNTDIIWLAWRYGWNICKSDPLLRIFLLLELMKNSIFFSLSLWLTLSSSSTILIWLIDLFWKENTYSMAVINSTPERIIFRPFWDMSELSRRRLSLCLILHGRGWQTANCETTRLSHMVSISPPLSVSVWIA